jgi:RNA polymerase sigma factor (sigma-70 family)
MSNPVYFEHIQGVDKLSLQDCVLQYQFSKNENLLRVILYKLRNTINYYLYTKTNYPDKSELIALYEDKLLECLMRYDSTKSKAQFVTFYSRCLDNALINFVNATANKRYDLSLDYEDSENGDESVNLHEMIGDEDVELNRLDTLLFFQSISQSLDDNERKVCAVILSNPHNLTYKEIALEIGLTLAAIPNILKRLRKKFNGSGIIAGNCVKSL